LDVGDSAPQKYDLHVLVQVDLLYAQIYDFGRRTLAAEHRYTEATTESLGGYQILSSENGGPQKWILLARQNLVAEYEALHQPEEAAKFRAASAKP
jgi:hypothetical protein